MTDENGILSLEPIAYIHTDFPEKFGIPRQAELIQELRGMIIFCPAYNKPGILKGLEQFTHLWLLWGFSENQTTWQPTVRPPRLGGNIRLGVFATRSPYRPNPIGLSAVQIEALETNNVIHVRGVDMVDKTPIYDIKPYLPYSDAVFDAGGGFADKPPCKKSVVFPDTITVPAPMRDMLIRLLELDPRPAYQNDPERIYGMRYADCHVHFRVCQNTVYVIAVERETPSR